jgi:hypothetical protein
VPRIVPAVDAYFKAIAASSDARWRDGFAVMDGSV